MVLSALTPDHFPVLVVAPKRVAENVWLTERDKWRTDVSMAVAKGSPAQRKLALDAGLDITVIGRDNVADVKPGRYKTIVLDELSGYRNRGTARWKHVRRLCVKANYVWGLTGTPSPNSLLDLWAQLFLLDKGDRLGTTLGAYRGRYFEVDTTAWTVVRGVRQQVVTSWKLKPGAESAIYAKIDDACLSMKAEDYLELPPVTHNEVIVPMPAHAKQAYRDMSNDLLSDMRDVGLEVHTAGNAAILSSKLSQISAGFLYSDDMSGGYTELHSEKLKAVQEIVDGTGSPVLVFYRYKNGEKDRIIRTIEGACSIDETDSINRWNAGKVPVLVAHPKSAGMGLNLQAGGHTIIWSSLTWSSEEWTQGNGRLARQGQDHPVMIHRLVSAPVDRAQFRRLTEKISVQDALLEALKDLF